MKLFILLALVAGTTYAGEGYGGEGAAPNEAPEPPPYSADAPNPEVTAAMEEMEGAEAADMEEVSADAEAPMDEEPASEPEPMPEPIDAPEYEATYAPATDAPEEIADEAAMDAPAEEAAPADMPADSYGPPPPLPLMDAPTTEAPLDVGEMNAATGDYMAPDPAEGGYAALKRTRKIKLSDIRLADNVLVFDPNCADHHEFCPFWAAIERGTIHPVTGKVVTRSECFLNSQKMLSARGCRKSCNYCTANRREWVMRRKLAATKLAILRRRKSTF